MEATKRRELPASAAAITFGATLDQPIAAIIGAAQPPVPTQVRPGNVRHVHSAAQWHRSIEAATNAYQPDSLANDPPWLQYLTPATLEGGLTRARYDLALRAAEVGDRAADRLTVIERLSTNFTQIPPERARNKAITATRLATLLYQEGEHHTAQHMAEETISLAEHIQSARLAADLQVLLQTMPPGTGHDDLRHRLSAVLTEIA